MATFFLPALPAGGTAAEQAYRELREQAEECTGSQARDRRIHAIECRLRGRDCCLRVGESDAATGRVVSAIIQLGRDTYTVHHVPVEAGEPLVPTVLQRTDVYSVTEFR
jgi:hypothetical protein